MITKLSGFLKLNLADLTKGCVVAVLAAALGGLQQMLLAHGLDFASYDWDLILTLATGGFTGYLSKNLISNEEGKVLGKIG